MYGIKWRKENPITKKIEEGFLISPFNLEKIKPIMKFNTREEAKENLLICEKVVEEDGLNMSFEIVDFDLEKRKKE